MAGGLASWAAGRAGACAGPAGSGDTRPRMLAQPLRPAVGVAAPLPCDWLPSALAPSPAPTPAPARSAARAGSPLIEDDTSTPSADGGARVDAEFSATEGCLPATAWLLTPPLPVLASGSVPCTALCAADAVSACSMDLCPEEGLEDWGKAGGCTGAMRRGSGPLAAAVGDPKPASNETPRAIFGRCAPPSPSLGNACCR